MNECGILKEAGRTLKKDCVGPESFFENSFPLFLRVFETEKSLKLPLDSHTGLYNLYSALFYFSHLMLRYLRYLHVPKANEHTYVLIYTHE